MSRFTQRLQRVHQATTVVPPQSSITHGIELTLADVGPWAIQGVAKGSETLTTLDPNGERLSTWPSDGRPSWIPGTTYVYNNNPTNHGGIVPAGGMVIDGYTIPAGTWVCQFYNFTDGVIISGDNSGTSAAWPGVVFRGCRMRGKYGAPGWFNQNGQSPGGIIWIMYCDAGGSVNSVTPSDMCESIFESKGMGSDDKLYVIRNYLSIATTLVFLRNDGDAAIENYCEIVTDFGDSSKHLNGIGNSGNQTATLWLRNHMYIPAQSGSTGLTDLIQMAADDGAYPGTGTNLDGSTGYRIDSNYLAGAQYCLQLGVDKSNTAATVKNVQVVNNKVSTNLFAHGGSAGLGYKGPTWGSYNNVFSGNTWVDGGNGVTAGTAIASSEIAPGP